MSPEPSFIVSNFPNEEQAILGGSAYSCKQWQKQGDKYHGTDCAMLLMVTAQSGSYQPRKGWCWKHSKVNFSLCGDPAELPSSEAFVILNEFRGG